MCVIFHFTWNQRGSHQNFSFLTSPMSLPCRALCQVLPGHRTCVPARYFSRGGNGCEPTDPRLYSFSVGTSDRKLIKVKWWLGKERQSTQKRGEGRSVTLWPWPREPQASEAAAGDSGAMPVSLLESSSCWLPSSPPRRAWLVTQGKGHWLSLNMGKSYRALNLCWLFIGALLQLS